MFLENRYFKVLKETRIDEGTAVFHCALLADCNVYRGHFPHKPVSPGVCNIEMIKECAMMLVGNDNLKITAIKQCRFTAIASPDVCPEVNVKVTAIPEESGYTIVANIIGEPKTENGDSTEYMTFKGCLC